MGQAQRGVREPEEDEVVNEGAIVPADGAVARCGRSHKEVGEMYAFSLLSVAKHAQEAQWASARRCPLPWDMMSPSCSRPIASTLWACS